MRCRRVKFLVCLEKSSHGSARIDMDLFLAHEANVCPVRGRASAAVVLCNAQGLAGWWATGQRSGFGPGRRCQLVERNRSSPCAVQVLVPLGTTACRCICQSSVVSLRRGGRNPTPPALGRASRPRSISMASESCSFLDITGSSLCDFLRSVLWLLGRPAV
jgi:hypothetical protein